MKVPKEGFPVELVVNEVRKFGELSCKQLAEILDVPNKSLSGLFKYAEKEGLIVKKGTGNSTINTKYKPPKKKK